MKVLLQRVNYAKVEIHQKTVGEIKKGFLIFLGVESDDIESDIDVLLQKILHLRVFADSDNKFNLSLTDIKGELLIVSQFTLFADVKKGRRPSFIKAAKPEKAKDLYEKFIKKAGNMGIKVATGEFGAYMQVSLTNDGPVTLMIESKDGKVF